METIVVNTKRQIDYKDKYCIYRRKNSKGTLMCSINKIPCVFFTKKAHLGCKQKVETYNTGLSLNKKRDPENLVYYEKIDKAPKPYQLPVKVDNPHKDREVNYVHRQSHTEVPWYADSNIKWKNANWTEKDVELRKVHVFFNFLYCSNHNHSLSYYKVKVRDVKDELKCHTANVIYCNTCDKFYIDATQYKHMRKSGILPRFKIVSEDYSQDIFSDFREESELSLYGYNARKDTPVSYRQRILYEVISNKLMRITDVISHLQGLIFLNESKFGTDNLIHRYEEDLAYIYRTFPGTSLENREVEI